MISDRRGAFALTFILFCQGIVAPARAGDDPPAVSGPGPSCVSLLTAEIPPSFVAEMQRQDGAIDPTTRRLRSAVQTVGHNEVALNRAVLAEHNNHYTLTLPRGEITNQHRSGRCWIFAATNMIRSMLLTRRLVDTEFNLSHNYIWFFHFLEQMNTQFEKVLTDRNKQFRMKELREKLMFSPQEGGYFEYFATLVQQYGLVPLEAMPDTAESYYPSRLADQLVEEMVLAAEQIRARAKAGNPSDVELRAGKQEFLRRVWVKLATHLGTPPTQIKYKKKQILSTDRDDKIGIPKMQGAEILTLTPREFAANIALFNPGEWVVLSVNPLKPKGVLYEVRKSALAKRSGSEVNYPRRYYNVDTAQLEKVVIRSLENLIPVWSGIDIGRQVDHVTGVMHPQIFETDGMYGPTFGAPADPGFSASVLYGHARPVHAVLLTGLDQPEGYEHPIKYQVENSWSWRAGDLGMYHMYREWFLKYNFEGVFHQSVLTDEERAWFEQKPRLIDLAEDVF